MRLPLILLFVFSVEALGEDLTPAPSKQAATPTSNNNPDLFAMVDQQVSMEADWRNWPLDPSQNEKASIETPVLVISYPYRNIHVTAYVYQLPNGGSGRPWITYVWVDRGKKYQSTELSPTPLMACAEHNTERWTSVNSISEAEWIEMDQIVTFIAELPLRANEKKVQSKRLKITQRVHPFPDKLLTQGGAAAIHELAWADGVPLARVVSARATKPLYAPPPP